ncbi:uncharacterized protein [Amphiura filiformis]|uniref:uncharacterized protein n=1 Tax=Amphiura filiformis TaxID=82378 RepID=UPI003B21276E
MMFSLIYLFAVLAIVESSSKFTYPKGLPCKIYNGTNCDCSNRQLSSIPLLKGHNVKSLDLSYNQLETVYRRSFIHLTLLQCLDLSHNQLGTVNGMSFIHLTTLLSLDLSHNNELDITNVTFTGLSKLENLDLSHQSHLTLHGSPFYSTASLKKLIITDGGLSSLPPSVFYGLHELQELDISGNDMRQYSFPDYVFQGLTNLTHLDASKCMIPSLPADLFRGLTSLKHLDLSDNVGISSLPETLFVNLISLKYLDLSSTFLSSLPEILFVNLTHLAYLDISDNLLYSTPCKAIEGLRMLSTLDISGNQFEYVTCGIEIMTTLKQLSISYNMSSENNNTKYWNVTKWSELITRLPASLSTLNLGIQSNSVFQTVKARPMESAVSFLTISYTVGCIFYDFHLSIEDDAFSIFPYLQNLTILNPWGNLMMHWYAYLNLSNYAFRGLLHLKSLHLSGLGLTKCPYKALEVLVDSLEYLDLSNNNIQDIRHYGQYIGLGLKSLDASRNSITNVDLQLFANLTNVYLNDIYTDTYMQLHLYITTYVALRSIHISAKYLTTLFWHYSKSLCTVYPALEEINFSKLNFFHPLAWGYCLHLKSLSISDSEGVDLFFSAKYEHYPHLENLSFTNCKLSSINQFLLESLQSLSLSGNNIANISGNYFSSLTNLKHLDLSNNEITSLQENLFHHMSNLTYLNLTGNKIDYLNALKGLYCLQILSVSSNVLTTLPAFLTKIPYNLQHVEFGDNSFSCTCDIRPLQDWILTDTKHTLIHSFHTCAMILQSERILVLQNLV